MSEASLHRHFLLWACLIWMKTWILWSSHPGVNTPTQAIRWINASTGMDTYRKSVIETLGTKDQRGYTMIIPEAVFQSWKFYWTVHIKCKIFPAIHTQVTSCNLNSYVPSCQQHLILIRYSCRHCQRIGFVEPSTSHHGHGNRIIIPQGNFKI